MCTASDKSSDRNLTTPALGTSESTAVKPISKKKRKSDEIDTGVGTKGFASIPATNSLICFRHTIVKKEEEDKNSS